MIRGTTQNMAFIHPSVDRIIFRCHGGMMNIFIIIAKSYLPEPALYMLRYHSFYSQHRENVYDHLLSAHDKSMFKGVDKFNPYDFYSKRSIPPVFSN